MDLGDKDIWYKVSLIVVLPVLFFLLPPLFCPRAPFVFAVAMKKNTIGIAMITHFLWYLITCNCVMVGVIRISFSHAFSRVTHRIICSPCCSDQFVPQCQGLSLPQRITTICSNSSRYCFTCRGRKSPAYVVQLCFALRSSISPSSILRSLSLYLC